MKKSTLRRNLIAAPKIRLAANEVVPAIPEDVIRWKQTKLDARKELVRFIHWNILLPSIDVAVVNGERILLARRIQKEFEERIVNKHLFSCTLNRRLEVPELLPLTMAAMNTMGLATFSDRRSPLLMNLLDGNVLGPMLLPSVLRSISPHCVRLSRVDGRVYCLLEDGTLVAWLPPILAPVLCANIFSPNAYKKPLPNRPLLYDDEASGMLIVNTTFIDGTFRYVEPVAGRVAAKLTVEVGYFRPQPPPNLGGLDSILYMCALRIQRLFLRYWARKRLTPIPEAKALLSSKHIVAQDYVYVHQWELLIMSAEESPLVLCVSPSSGKLHFVCRGHRGGPPIVRYDARLNCLMTGGSGGTSTEQEPDFSVRLWDSEAELSREFTNPRQRLRPRICAAARIISGHQGPIHDITFVPEVSLLVSASADSTVRCWDPLAKPYALSHPEGLPHVRIWPGYYKKLDAEWTKTNTPFCESVTLPLSQPCQRLHVMQNGPVSILMACLGGQGAQSGALCSWVLGRGEFKVKAIEFDEQIPQHVLQETEEFTLLQWRQTFPKLQAQANISLDVATKLDNRRTALRVRINTLLRNAWLQRPSVLKPPVPGLLGEVFEVSKALFEHMDDVHQLSLLSSDEVYTLLALFAHLPCTEIDSATSFYRWSFPFIATLPPLAAAPKSVHNSKPLSRAKSLSQDAGSLVRDTVRMLGAYFDSHRFALAASCLDPFSNTGRLFVDINHFIETFISSSASARYFQLLISSLWLDLWKRSLARLSFTLLGLRNPILRRHVRFIQGDLEHLFRAHSPPKVLALDLVAVDSAFSKELVVELAVDWSKEINERSEDHRPVFEGVDEERGALVAVTVLSDSYLGETQSDGLPRSHHHNFELEAMRRLFLNPLYLHVLGWRDQNVDLAEGWVQGNQGIYVPTWERFVITERLDGWLPLSYVTYAHRYLGSDHLLPLLRHWGRLLLEALHSLTSVNVLLRGLHLDSVFVSPDGLQLKIVSLSEMALVDDRGYVFSAVDRPAKHLDPSNAYLPPEHFTEKLQAHSYVFDIWTFGCLLFELVFGHPPASYGSALISFTRSHGLAAPSPLQSSVPNEFFYDFLSTSSQGDGGPQQVDRLGRAVLRGLSEAGSFSFHRIVPWLSHQEVNVLDIIALCLDTDPVHRPTASALLSTSFFNLNDHERLLMKSAAATYMASKRPDVIYHEMVGEALEELHESVKAASGSVDMDQFSAVVDRLGATLLGTAQWEVEPMTFAGLSAAMKSNVRALQTNREHVIKEVFDNRAVDQLVLLAMRFMTASRLEREGERVEMMRTVVGGKDGVRIGQIQGWRHYEAWKRQHHMERSWYFHLDALRKNGLAWPRSRRDGYPDPNHLLHRRKFAYEHFPDIEPEYGPAMVPSEQAKHVMSSLVSLLKDLLQQLRDTASLLAPYVEPILHALLKLFVGEERLYETFGDVADIDHPRQLAWDVNHWNPVLYEMIAPIVQDVFTESGRGNREYPVIRDFLTGESKRSGSVRVYMYPPLLRPVQVAFPRQPEYHQELVEAGKAAMRMLKRKEPKARLAGVRHFHALLQLGKTPKALLCLHFRLVDRLVPLLEDADPEVRLGVLQTMETISKHIFHSSEDRRNPLCLLAIELCQPVSLASIHRRWQLPHEQLSTRVLALRVLGHMFRGDDPVARVLARLDVPSALARSLIPNHVDGQWQKPRNGQLDEVAHTIHAMFADIFKTGNPPMLWILQQTPELMATLHRRGINTQTPLSLPKYVRVLEQITTTVGGPPGRRAMELPEETELALGVNVLAKLAMVVRRRHHLQDLQNVDLATDATMKDAVDATIKCLSSLWNFAVADPASAQPCIPLLHAGLRLFETILEATPSLLHHVLAALTAFAPWTSTPLTSTTPTDPSSTVRTRSPSDGPTASASSPHPLNGPLAHLQQLFRNALRMRDSRVLEALVSINFVEHFLEHIRVQFAAISHSFEARSLASLLASSYVQGAEFRREVLTWLLSNPDQHNLHRLIYSTFIEDLLLSYLPNAAFLDVGNLMVPLEFLPYDGTFLIRSETVRLLGVITQHAASAPDVHEHFIVMLKRHRVVARELDRINTSEHRHFQALGVDLLTVLALDPDPQVQQELIEHDVASEVERLQLRSQKQDDVVPLDTKKMTPADRLYVKQMELHTLRERKAVLRSCAAFFEALASTQKRECRPTPLMPEHRQRRSLQYPNAVLTSSSKGRRAPVARQSRALVMAREAAVASMDTSLNLLYRRQKLSPPP